MGLFHQNFDKPGPGVSPDAPRKKGAARFFEILGRDFSTIWMAGLLALISSLPFALLLWLAVSTHSLLPMLAAGILGGMIAAPQIVGLNDTILRSLRDEPGFWWATYRRAWKRNVKASLLPGAVCGLLLAMEIFTAFHLDISQSVVPAVAVLVALILLAGIAQYIYAQVALFWPVSSFAVILCSLWLPCLLNLMAIYPALDKSFDLEKTIKAMRDAQLNSENEDK